MKSRPQWLLRLANAAFAGAVGQSTSHGSGRHAGVGVPELPRPPMAQTCRCNSCPQPWSDTAPRPRHGTSEKNRCSPVHAGDPDRQGGFQSSQHWVLARQSDEDALCRFLGEVRIAIGGKDHELALAQSRADVTITGALPNGIRRVPKTTTTSAVLRPLHPNDHLQMIDVNEQHRTVHDFT